MEFLEDRGILVLVSSVSIPRVILYGHWKLMQSTALEKILQNEAEFFIMFVNRCNGLGFCQVEEYSTEFQKQHGLNKEGIWDRLYTGGL